MRDRIAIKGLSVETRVGVTDKERSSPQDVIIDIEIVTDLDAAAASDSLADTLDYEAIVDGVAALVRTSECNLLEALAGKIIAQVAALKGVVGVTVEVMKAHVPVNEDVAGIAVKVARGSLS